LNKSEFLLPLPPETIKQYESLFQNMKKPENIDKLGLAE
jgi:hypothetical protein